MQINLTSTNNSQSNEQQSQLGSLQVSQKVFKSQRLKYLQQRKGHKKQIKKIRRQQFGSSSSESQEQQKPKPQPKPKPQINMKKIKDQIVQQSSPVDSLNDEQQFRKKHQAYLKQKRLRKQKLLEQRRKQFGSSSSSDSDQEYQPKTNNNQNKSKQAMKQNQKISHSSASSSKVQTPINKTSILVNKIEQSPLPMIQKDKKAFETKKISIMVQSKKNNQWVEQTLLIMNKQIKFLNQNIQFSLAIITKIKLFFTQIIKDHMKIKITIKNDIDYIIIVSNTQQIQGVSAFYYVFSRIIQQKLSLIGIQFKKKNLPQSLPNFSNLKDIPSQLKSSFIYGNILKKSQVLGNWQTRFTSIDSSSINSSKKATQKPSMKIACNSIGELWSRFDIEDNKMLNIKIMYNSTKTQFGIPLSHYTDQYNWLYCFYKTGMIQNK